MTESNTAAALKDYIDRLFNLAEEVDGLKDDNKELKKEMRDNGIPIDEVLRTAKLKAKDDAEQDELLQKQNTARQLLKMPAFELSEEYAIPDGYDEDDVGQVQNRVQTIMSNDEEIKALKADQKEILKEAKNEGFVPKVLQLLVQFKQDPEKRKAYQENNSVLHTYESALDGS